MGTEIKGTAQRIGKILLFGGAGALLFLMAALAAAAAAERSPALLSQSGVWMKALLFLTSALSGGLCARKAREKKLLYAAAGEWGMLLICLISALALHDGALRSSFGINLLLIFFGAFAGTIAFSGKKTRRRRRSEYRK